ncbi:MAG: SpoIIE family protein phosphatase [Acidobacteriota bacterium]|nr:SpoIIE family protein phosphatase [Acidobacteriota bacterium]
MSTRLSLRVIPPEGDTFDRSLEGDQLLVGRASDCDVTIADRFLSRHHLRFVLDGDNWAIEDLGSRNGTLVNNRPVSKPIAVRPGDHIRISGTKISVFDPLLPQEAEESWSSLGPHTILKPASELIDTGSGTKVQKVASEDDLRHYAGRLQLLNEVHRALASSVDLEDLLDLILEKAFEHLGPEEAVIYLDSGDDGYERAAVRTAAEEEGGYFYSTTLVEEVARKGLAALVLDMRNDERFNEADSIVASGVRSLVAAPLMDAEGSVGMIALSSRLNRRQFTEEDMEVLTSLASAAALRIRNLALADEAVKRRQLEQELDLARQIQVGLIPTELPKIAGYDIFGRNTPSRGVSGDIYEVVPREESKDCVLVLVDVSGKGMAASILTASFEALAAGPIREGCAPDEIAGRVNQLLFERTAAAKYATAFVAVLEPASGALSYASGGHNASLLVRRSGAVERLESTGTPLGLLAKAVYGRVQTSLGPGDMLLAYTDGFTEAAAPTGEEFGIERLEEFCRENRSLPLAEFAEILETRLVEFVGSNQFGDDCTLLVARRKDSDTGT